MEGSENQRPGNENERDDKMTEEQKVSHPSTGGSVGGVSFTFQKKKSGSRVRPREGNEKGEGNAEGKDFVLSVEGKEIRSLKPKPEKQEFVVPLIRKNVWRMPAGRREGSGSSGTDKEGGGGGGEKCEEEMKLEREAAEAIMRDVEEAKLRGSGSIDDGVVVPLMMQNKPPTVEGREEDELADVELRPEQSSLEDYEAMPIDVFGEAVLRGMGWKKGEPIGKTNKGLAEPIEFIGRVGGLGLGATAKMPEKKPGRIRKPGEVERKIQRPYVDSKGRVRHVKKVGEEIPEQPPQGFGVGRCVRVLQGPHEGLYGKIVGLDEDSARVVLRLVINGQNVSLGQRHLELVEEEEYRRYGRGSGGTGAGEKRYGLITKKDGGSRSPSPYRVGEVVSQERRQSPRTATVVDNSTHIPLRTSDHRRGHKHADRDRDEDGTGAGTEKTAAKKARLIEDLDANSSKSRARDNHGDSYRHKDSRKHKGATSRSEYGEEASQSKRTLPSSGNKHWLAPNLRVRIVDTKYRKGLHYNTKVVIIDVISTDTCICQTEDGKLLEGVKQYMLETVVPKMDRAVVMVVEGKWKRQIATILKRDKSKYKVIAELVQSGEVLTMDYDDICEYVGNVEDFM